MIFRYLACTNLHGQVGSRYVRSSTYNATWQSMAYQGMDVADKTMSYSPLTVHGVVYATYIFVAINCIGI